MSDRQLAALTCRCGYYASAEAFLRELRSVIVSVGKDAEPLTKELLPIIEQVDQICVSTLLH